MTAPVQIPEGHIQVKLDVYNNIKDVYRRTFSAPELIAVSDNLDLVWRMCCQDTPLLEVNAHFALTDQLLLNELKTTLVLSDEFLDTANPPEDGYLYTYITMCISILCLMTSTKVALCLLEYDTHGTILGIQPALADVLEVRERAINRDIQLAAIANVVHRSAYHMFPTRPIHGSIAVISKMNLPEDITEAVLKHALGVKPKINIPFQ